MGTLIAIIIIGGLLIYLVWSDEWDCPGRYFY